jgi:hypothetical protein
MLEAGEGEAQSSNGCNGTQGKNDNSVSERHTFSSALVFALRKPKPGII